MREFPPCERCTGLCCRAEASWKAVPLTKAEQEREPFKSISVPSKEHPEQVVFYFDETDGCCRFLDRVTRRCTIYHERPEACRRFDCRTQPWMSPFFKDNPQMLKVISDWEKAGATTPAAAEKDAPAIPGRV